jgi:hypothetical protein
MGRYFCAVCGDTVLQQKAASKETASVRLLFRVHERNLRRAIPAKPRRPVLSTRHAERLTPWLSDMLRMLQLESFHLAHVVQICCPEILKEHKLCSNLKPIRLLFR